MRMLSEVRQALYRLRRQTARPDLKGMRTCCQFRQLEGVAENPGLPTLFRIRNKEADIPVICKEILRPVYVRMHT